MSDERTLVNNRAALQAKRRETNAQLLELEAQLLEIEAQLWDTRNPGRSRSHTPVRFPVRFRRRRR